MSSTRTKAKKKETTVTRASKRNNPHGANQIVPDPRQSIFLSLYLDPKSDTFSNAYQSALKAGYSEEYSQVMKGQMPVWLSESLSELQMLSKAERNLDRFLDVDHVVQAMGAFGPIFEKVPETVTKTVKGKKKRVVVMKKVPVMVVNPKIMAQVKDVSFFVAERIGRLRYKKGDVQPASPIANVAVQVNVQDDRDKYA